MNEVRDMNDVFSEYESELEEKTKREIAEEEAVWNALPQKMKDTINEAFEARMNEFHSSANDDDDLEEEDDDEDL